MKRLANSFLQGLLLLVPISVTIYVFVSVFLLIDSWLGLTTPGLGVLILVVATTVIGFFASSFFAGRLQRALDGLFRRLPFIKLLYGAVRDLLSAVVGNERRFDRPVLVDLFAGAGSARVVGFVTRTSLTALGQTDDMVAVYLPQSYNFSGLLLVVPKAHVHPLPMAGADALAFVLSGGLSLGNGAPSPGQPALAHTGDRPMD